MKTWLPLTFIGFGVLIIVLTEWLRHRSWLKHRDSGFAPSTQGIAMIGTFATGAAFVAALVSWLVLR